MKRVATPDLITIYPKRLKENAEPCNFGSLVYLYYIEVSYMEEYVEFYFFSLIRMELTFYILNR